MYKYEVHLHTCGCSRCGVSTQCEMVEAAANAGYAGIVFTNHFYRGNTCIDRDWLWRDFVAAYRSDYITAKKYGERLDIDVLFGIEENYWGGHEALIYGLEPDTLVYAPALADMTIEQLSDFTHSNGGAIFCAHPFRDRSYVVDPYREPETWCFDGFEAYNLYNTPETNMMAAAYAKERGIRIISGGDVHNAVNFGKTGLAFSQRIRTNAELVSAMLSDSYQLLIDGEPYTQEQALDIIINMPNK